VMIWLIRNLAAPSEMDQGVNSSMVTFPNKPFE
jgi:hypothetical protein